MTRPFLPGYSNYGYQDPQYGSSSIHSSSPMQGVEIQYAAGYVQDVSRQHAVAQAQSSQPYAQYAQGSMLPAHQRQTAAIEVMSSQLGAVPHYIQHGEAHSHQLQPLSSHYAAGTQSEQVSFPSAGMSRASLQSQYSAGGSDYGLIEQQAQQQTAQQSAADQEALEEGFREYEQQLRATFDAIIAGRLTEASEKIMPLSRWLTSSVEAMGELWISILQLALTNFQDYITTMRRVTQSVSLSGEISIYAGKL
jgi:hypothetical protein